MTRQRACKVEDSRPVERPYDFCRFAGRNLGRIGFAMSPLRISRRHRYVLFERLPGADDELMWQQAVVRQDDLQRLPLGCVEAFRSQLDSLGD